MSGNRFLSNRFPPNPFNTRPPHGHAYNNFERFPLVNFNERNYNGPYGFGYNNQFRNYHDFNASHTGMNYTNHGYLGAIHPTNSVPSYTNNNLYNRDCFNPGNPVVPRFAEPVNRHSNGKNRNRRRGKKFKNVENPSIQSEPSGNSESNANSSTTPTTNSNDLVSQTAEDTTNDALPNGNTCNNSLDCDIKTELLSPNFIKRECSLSPLLTSDDIIKRECSLSPILAPSDIKIEQTCDEEINPDIESPSNNPSVSLNYQITSNGCESFTSNSDVMSVSVNQISNGSSSPVIEQNVLENNINYESNSLNVRSCVPELADVNNLNMTNGNINNLELYESLDIKPDVPIVNGIDDSNCSLIEHCFNIFHDVKTEPVDNFTSCESVQDNTGLNSNPYIKHEPFEFNEPANDEFSNELQTINYSNNINGENNVYNTYVEGNNYNNIENTHSSMYSANGNVYNNVYDNGYEINNVYGNYGVNGAHVSDSVVGNNALNNLPQIYLETPVYNNVQQVTPSYTVEENSVPQGFNNSLPVDNGTSVNRNVPATSYNHSFTNSRNVSPERKYMHLIRVDSTSPERKFLERINKPRTSKKRCRSRSPGSEERLRLSPTPPRKYCKSPNERFSQKYSARTRCTPPQNSADRASHRLEPTRRTWDSNNFGKRQHEPPSRSENLYSNKNHNTTEREELLRKYTKNYCANMNEVKNMMDKLSPEEMMKRDAKVWSRMSPATLYYKRTAVNVVEGTHRLSVLCKKFEDVLVKRAEKIRASKPQYEPPERKQKVKFHSHKHNHGNRSSSSSSSDSSSSSSGSDFDSSSEDEEDRTMQELERKQSHPFRLHPELWYNDPGDMNDGPLCRCSAKARRCGIRHNIYAGEHDLPKCTLNSNNGNKLYHYRITISPPTNFLIKTPTIISHDDHEFIFEGFSMFSHSRLDKLPVCKVIRFNIEYTILYFEEQQLENFTIKELDLFHQYLFKEILELVDLDFKAAGDKTLCDQFHFMPRFVRELSDHGKEILSMNEVLKYLLNNCDDLVKDNQLETITSISQYEWQKQVDLIKGMVVTVPGMKPCSLRVDQLDRDDIKDGTLYPEIVHFGIRPPQLSYAGNPEYQKAWREYVKFRHLLANMSKPSFEDKRKLEVKETKLQEMRTQSKMKRDVTVTVNSKGFKKTGIMCDIVQHAMLIPVLVSHLRFHCSLSVLESVINYKFKNRFLLQLALTHPSYRENFGTNPDHARNSLTNCGIRQPEYGDRRIHYLNTRKRGINTLINIMSRFGKKKETESNITHNERLEFLGDAVVEFITSIHLFHMFPELEEGGLATYRAAIVQNQHLAVLARVLKLDEFMLYAHGSDLCHDLELRHAMANCFEALMGALFLDGGIKVADKVFGETLFKSDHDLLPVWVDYPPHPLQEQEPLGDRKWIPRFTLLNRLTKFEDSIGVEFTHIRLLARSFTDRSIGFTNLTLGSNQRLEFLGDTVLQLIASEYLYKYFPEHHEGHLSLLRSSLVNNRTQAVVCDDLGMTKYALYNNPKAELKTKDRADLLEAFLGALYVDKGLEYCELFCNVCFFPRLQTFIMRQDWNDPKSKLQQCCLTLRTMEGGEPEIPIYKVIECMGPTNTRVYTVAVYFKAQRLAEASGHSIQQAEMNAAKKALQRSYSLFPQLDHQKRVIAKSMKKQHCPKGKAGTPGSTGNMQNLLMSNTNQTNYKTNINGKYYTQRVNNHS